MIRLIVVVVVVIFRRCSTQSIAANNSLKSIFCLVFNYNPFSYYSYCCVLFVIIMIPLFFFIWFLFLWFLCLARLRFIQATIIPHSLGYSFACFSQFFFSIFFSKKYTICFPPSLSLYFSPLCYVSQFIMTNH